jgi:hypothetical protein
MATTPDTTLTLYGFWHLEGETVRCSILGIDLGTAVIQANGSGTWTYGSDAGGLLTPAYLRANTNALTGVEQNATFTVVDAVGPVAVTVPVVVGIDYTTQGQLLRPDVAADIHSPLGPGLGKTRRGHMFAVLVQNAVKISFGTDFSSSSTLTPATFTTADGFTARAEDSPYTGVYWSTLKDGYGFESMLCWQVNRPYACTICSASVFLDVSER